MVTPIDLLMVTPCLALENIDGGTPRDQRGSTYTLMAGGRGDQSSPPMMDDYFPVDFISPGAVKTKTRA